MTKETSNYSSEPYWGLKGIVVVVVVTLIETRVWGEMRYYYFVYENQD